MQVGEMLDLPKFRYTLPSLPHTQQRKINQRNVVTVELSEVYAKRAIARFEREMTQENNTAVERIALLIGDSGELLRSTEVFQQLGRTMWFLDGHYSYMDTARGQEDSPLMAELEWILNGPRGREGDGDIIFVDDAREFRGTRFPSSVNFGRRQDGDGACPEADEACVPPAEIAYPELSDVIEKICEWAPSSLVDLERDMLKIRRGVGRVASG